ncbi:MAG: ABC transporter permease [Nanoarchaeota archaeon]
MKLDEIRYSVKNIWQRKLRSFLTILSILIGITSIFALVSFGLGIQKYVDTLAQEAGTDKLFVQAKSIGAPGTDENFFISKDDVEFIGKINGVTDISGMYFKVGEIESNDEKLFAFISSLDPDKMDFILEAFTVDIDKGRQLKKGDSNKVALGYNYQLENKLFDRPLKLRDKIKINSEPFEVVGFFKEIGNPQDDSNIYMLPETVERLFPDTKGKFGFVMVRADKNVNPQDLADKILEKLRKRKGQEEGKEDFYVQTFEDALATFGAVVNVLNGILVLIALISLVVASVNIMNTMYTAVLERTNEIGIMKAIGARNKVILFIFVFESGFLGFVGGIVGIFVGWLFASTGGKIAASAGYSLLQPAFPWYLTAGCLLFATAIGAGSGFLPAIQASRLKPVEALRYE